MLVFRRAETAQAASGAYDHVKFSRAVAYALDGARALPHNRMPALAYPPSDGMRKMKEIVSNPKLVAYCGACKAYLKECYPGCHENRRATWCKVRSCCANNEYA